MMPDSLIQRKLFAPPRACVPANIALVFASSWRTNFTASSPVFERVMGQLPLKRRVERVISHHYDIAKLLAGVLDGLVY
jgi:hypothetical protein